MLLPREQNPWNCGYVLGAAALRVLGQGSADLPDLQRRMAETLGRRISPTQAIAACAWLYLIKKIRLDERGVLHLCD